MNWKKYLPKPIRNLRHFFYAWYGAVKYHHPSEEMLVIGVTGTSGKSTTVFLLRQMLEFAGFKVGSLSTIDFYINGEDKLNDQKMTMLGKMKIQEYLREMVNRGCEVAIVETTSEGHMQYRDRYISYDFMILTNLYPEHIEAHGSFENYKQAKIGIFKRASVEGKEKPLDVLEKYKGKWDMLTKKSCCGLEKTFIVNGDIPEFIEFFSAAPLPPENFVVFGKTLVGITEEVSARKITHKTEIDERFLVEDVSSDGEGLHFKVREYRFDPEMYGEHNAMNIVITIAVARQLGIEWSVIQKAVHSFHNAPGRTEFITEAEKKGFKVIVDYAFEPKAMAALYSVVDLLKPKRIIQVFGSTGGGRDVSRRFSVGEMAGKKADVCIITDEDPYDDEPMKIMEDVATAVRKMGKRDGSNLFIIPDRRAAIAKALQMADVGDLVLVTGKGSEQAIVVAGGKKIAWDDRTVVREELFRLENIKT